MGFHPEWSDISAWITRSRQLFIKKLARNDAAWADSARNGHQNGFFIPRAIAESGLFPRLNNSNPEKPHIFDVEYPTLWPASGEVRRSTIKYFSLRNPGKANARPRHEWQHTGMPKDQFKALSPASLLLVGKLEEEVSGASYWFVVVDSVSQEAEILETVFQLDADFHHGLFDPALPAAPTT